MEPLSAMKYVAQRILPEKTYRRLVHKLRSNIHPTEPTVSLRDAMEKQTLSDESLLEIKNIIEIKRRMDYEPHDIYLHVDSLTEFETRLYSCAKEPDTVEWIETFMKPGDTFYDVGANVGAYSLIAAKAFKGAVKVFAFEPAFLNFTQLCRNVFLNQCQDIIIPLCVALSDKTSLDSFNYHDLIPGGSLHTLGEAIDYKGDRFEPVLKQPIVGFTTDDFISQFGVPVPTHIKIDVDGIEFSVLKGADRTLSNPSLRSIVVELEAGESEKQIGDFLAQKGFRLHARYGRRTPGMINSIFARP
jgi:FkbM family methyltransferase